MNQSAQEAWTRLESWLARGWVVAASILASLCIGIGFAAPHLDEAIWQDEVTTILLHASRGIVDPFVHYVSPNSHIAFTSMLAAWLKLFPGGVDLPTLRALPLLLFAAAIPLTFAASRKLGGIVPAHLGTLLFATSAVTENFATQLRGYGPSWVFLSAGLFCALAARTQRAWLLGYMGGCVGAVAMLPTNVFLMEVIGASVAAMALFDPPSPGQRPRIVALLVIPGIALLVAYGAVWRELTSFAGIDLSNWSRAGLAWEWLRGANSNLWLVIPLAGSALALVVNDAFSSRRFSPTVVAALGLTLGLMLLLAVMPNPPFPRTLVPYLPVWIAAVCCLAVWSIRRIDSRRATWIGGTGAVLLSASLALGPQSETCREAPSNGDKFQYDLCHQYFRDHYNPAAVLDAWAAQPIRRPIVSDFEGYYSIYILGSGANVFEYRGVDQRLRSRPLIVAHDAADARMMLVHMGMDPRVYRLAADTGYFKVFRPDPLP